MPSKQPPTRPGCETNLRGCTRLERHPKCERVRLLLVRLSVGTDDHSASGAAAKSGLVIATAAVTMKRFLIVLITLLSAILITCSREQRDQRRPPDVNETGAYPPASVQVGREPTPAEMERERFAEEWRRVQSFRADVTRRQIEAGQAPQRDLPIAIVPTGEEWPETLKTTNPATIESSPVHLPIRGDISGPSVLKAQILLDLVSFSGGVIDGRWGKNSAIGVYWFQRERGLEATGEIDETTFRELAAAADNAPAVVAYMTTASDVEGPFVDIPDNVYAQQDLKCMCYESLEEKLAERFHTTVELLQMLNPEVRLNDVRRGQTLIVPNIRPPVPDSAPKDVVRIVVSVGGNYLHAYDAQGAMIFHAPTTVGSKYDPSPSETLKLVRTAFDPWFKYQPKLYYEVPDEEPEADLPPGPNSPVGVVWMALSKPHYGIHGTARPETIGYASSHGCIRLTNWDARDLARRTPERATVDFVDTRD